MGPVFTRHAYGAPITNSVKQTRQIKMDNRCDKINFKNMIMNKIALLMLICILQISMAYSQHSGTDISIIPAPAILKKSAGEFIFNQSTVIKTDKPENKAIVFFIDYLKNSWNLKNKIITKTSNKGLSKNETTIVLTNSGVEGLPDEGYRLSITQNLITIRGKEAGLFLASKRLCSCFRFKNRKI